MSLTADHHHGGIADQARRYASNHFGGRERDSRILIVVFGFVGCLLIGIAAATGRLNAPVAVFVSGTTCLTIASVFVIGWGASTGHGETCECNAIGLEQVSEEINARLDEISIRLNTRLDQLEGSEREMVSAVRDELSRRRDQN